MGEKMPDRNGSWHSLLTVKKRGYVYPCLSPRWTSIMDHGSEKKLEKGLQRSHKTHWQRRHPTLVHGTIISMKETLMT